MSLVNRYQSVIHAAGRSVGSHHIHLQRNTFLSSDAVHIAGYAVAKRLCIFGPKGAIQIRYYPPFAR